MGNPLAVNQERELIFPQCRKRTPINTDKYADLGQAVWEVHCVLVRVNFLVRVQVRSH